MDDPEAGTSCAALLRLAARRELLDLEHRAPPRVVLFLLDGGDPASLRQAIQRIPSCAEPWLTEIVVMQERETPALRADDLRGGRTLALRLHRDLSTGGPGGAHKAAFEYALRGGFEHAIVMRSGLHPPEALPELLATAIEEPDRLVIASRFVERRESSRTGTPIARVAAHALATLVQNLLLGLRLRDHHSSFRVYPVRALSCVPFQLDADDRRFGTEVLIQLRALGIPLVEVEVLPAWREEPARRAELAMVLRAGGIATGYRLHQLHVTRDGRYLVDPGVHYTLKQSRTSSHMQIVEAIRPGSLVLDLGCSQGLLARPLREKHVRVVGVDARAPERMASELAAYRQRDLEQPLELPEGRVFDYVVCADVIEHLRERQQLLRSARRWLRPEGRLVISTPNVALWFYRLSLLVGRFEYGPRGVLDHTHVHLYTLATFRREVERAGYRILRERVTALPFEVVFESTGRSRLLRGLAEAYHGLARLWPSLFAYQFILEAEVTTLDEDATHRPSEV